MEKAWKGSSIRFSHLKRVAGRCEAMVGGGEVVPEPRLRTE